MRVGILAHSNANIGGVVNAWWSKITILIRFVLIRQGVYFFTGIKLNNVAPIVKQL